MYINHTTKNHDKCAEEKQREREACKKGRSQHTSDFKKSTGNSGTGNASLCPHICHLHCELTVKCPRLKEQKLLESTTSQTSGPGGGTAHKMVTDYI